MDLLAVFTLENLQTSLNISITGHTPSQPEQ